MNPKANLFIAFILGVIITSIVIYGIGFEKPIKRGPLNYVMWERSGGKTIAYYKGSGKKLADFNITDAKTYGKLYKNYILFTIDLPSGKDTFVIPKNRLIEAQF